MSKNDFAKKETFFFLTVGLLFAGFLAGVFYSAFEFPPRLSASPPLPSQLSTPPNQAALTLYLEQEVSSSPENYEAWAQLGHAYFDANQYGKAIRAYQQSLDLFPDNPDVLTELGVIHHRSAAPQKALEAFEKAAFLDPRHEQSRFNKGVVLLNDLHDPQGAIESWKSLLAVNPDATAPNGTLVSELITEIEQSHTKERL